MHLWEIRAHDAIHHREVAKMLQAPPQDFSSGVVALTAPHKPAELCDPLDRLAQRRWLRRRHWDAMDGTIERLPFVGLQQHTTRRLGHRAHQHGGVKNPPRQHAVERQTTLQALSPLALTRFQATTAFQNPMPDLNGMITNDKFCCTRWSQLHLAWWRRPLRLRSSPGVRGILLRTVLHIRRRNS
jgi:hypothetical protein